MTALVDPSAPTAHGLAARIAAGELSPVEAVAEAVERAIEVAARCSTASPRSGSTTPCSPPIAPSRRSPAATGSAILHGVPVAVKDTTPVAGRRTTLGSYAFEHWVPDHDAYVVTRPAAGRGDHHRPDHDARSSPTRCRPTARSGASPATPTTRPARPAAPRAAARRPWRRGASRWPRAPTWAARCASRRHGAASSASSPASAASRWTCCPGLFDSISHHGPLARCADDARLFLAATQGPDDADIMSVPGPLDLSRPLDGDVAGMRLGLSVDLGCFAVDPEIAAAVTAAAERLESAGATVDLVDPHFGEDDEAAWGLLWSVFMATYYGDTARGARRAHGSRRRPPDRCSVGQVSAVEHKRVEIHRTAMWRRLAPILADHDALLCPTMAHPPWPAAKADRLEIPPTDGAGYHSPDMTAVFNLVAPCPAISVPCGTHTSPEHAGLPIGLQVVGRRWREDTVLRDRPRRRTDVVTGFWSGCWSHVRPRSGPKTDQRGWRVCRRAARSSGVAAATGVRRAAWSSTDEVAAERVDDDGAGLLADQRGRQVVPHAVGVGGSCRRTRRACRRRPARGRAPTRRAPGTGPSRSRRPVAR